MEDGTGLTPVSPFSFLFLAGTCSHFRRPRLLGQPGTEHNLSQASRSQLICCKSIDKLISDSEDPERRLKKTLGPVSLTALGIGAVIGSGIFTVIGTPLAAQKFATSSILNAPLLDYMIRH